MAIIKSRAASPEAIQEPRIHDGENVTADDEGKILTSRHISYKSYTPNSNPPFLPVEQYQLPSPSPSPSPRSTSPVLTEASSAEYTGSGEDTNGQSLAPVLEVDSAASDSVEKSVEPALSSPKVASKKLSMQLADILEEKTKKPRKLSLSKNGGDERVLKLSPSEIQELTSQPDSLPVGPTSFSEARSKGLIVLPAFKDNDAQAISSPLVRACSHSTGSQRQPFGFRAISTSQINHRDGWSERASRQLSPTRRGTPMNTRSEPFDPNTSIKLSSSKTNLQERSAEPTPTVATQEIPLPPLLSTYLQLELASSRPSPLYIHRTRANEYPYESSRVKFERLLNFLLVPWNLEPALWFGTLACLDAWLYTFTILPLRFIKAASILAAWWGSTLAKEARFIMGFVYHGSSRLWARRRGRASCSDSQPPSRAASEARRPSGQSSSLQSPARAEELSNGYAHPARDTTERKPKVESSRRHKRTKSIPSTLSSYHKADLLQGLLIICSSVILMRFDASRMYHSIRGQAAMKLYVIYNVIEVGDRLLSALGQDTLECLVSDETLGRGLDGRSKILRPIGMFLLALVYNIAHSTLLFYQVITLNVAVNSYSNSLFTLLMSNQFVEIKGTVFKRIEKPNLFQLFCADVVERFQLLLMLTIIGMRNIVEVGGLSIVASSYASEGADAIKNATVPLRTSSIIPNSFMIIPNWSGEVLSPFLVVLASEVVVDWIKHCYVCKFNNVKPPIYQRFLDILSKDYYTNAFVDQNLTKRLGLPVIPLSCLFIRASFQTYHMFVASHFPPPLPSTATSISLEASAAASPATTAAMEHIDSIIRKALGRSTYGIPDAVPKPWYMIDSDDIIAFIAMAAFFLGVFLALLAIKLVLGMLLLRYARSRYQTLNTREKVSLDTKGKRIGGFGITEMDEEKKAIIYEDDPEGYLKMKERERKWEQKAREERGGVGEFENVRRYEMATKRIW